MAQYVVHKVGFFYTDECFAVGEEKGTVIAITKSLEEARAIKKREDIISLKGVTGCNAVDFYFDSSNYKEIDKKMVAYYQSEFNLTINHDAPFYEFPKKINDEQALKFLEIMELSFHTIVEYGDDEVIDPADYEFDQEEGEIGGF